MHEPLISHEASVHRPLFVVGTSSSFLHTIIFVPRLDSSARPNYLIPHIIIVSLPIFVTDGQRLVGK